MSSLPPPPPGTAPVAETIPACYRHPNKPAFRRCTRCERSACNDCLVPGSIGSLCPDCAKVGRPAAPERIRRWNATRGGLFGTFGLILVNVAVGIYTLSSPIIGQGIHRGEFRLAVDRFLVDHGEWWRIFTSGFTHFGVVHLAMNMLSLYFLGRVVEPALGRPRFLALYLASMLAGTAGALIMQPGLGLTAGASGAIFGLLGATAIGLRQRGIRLMQTSIGTMILLNLVITFTISGISIGGHLGGLVGGAICGYVMFAPQHKAFPKWAQWLTPAVVGAISFAICLLVSRGAADMFLR
jgi:membrane associated rhomboid family serine protease